MKLKHIFIPLIVAINLCACYTLVTDPQVDGQIPTSINGVTLLNGNREVSPRTFMTDGIVTLKADYSKWTNKLILKFAENRKNDFLNPNRSKWLSLSFQSIACGGSFITNCAATVMIESSDGAKSLLSTENYYGYGWPVAMEKVIADLALRLQADNELNKFLYQ